MTEKVYRQIEVTLAEVSTIRTVTAKSDDEARMKFDEGLVDTESEPVIEDTRAVLMVSIDEVTP